MAYADELGHFMQGLGQEESGGRYDLKPNAAGASGKYQFLDSTWGGFGGYKEAWQAPPQIQDQRAAQLMTSYYQKFGSWGAVAQAWLGGPGSVGKNVVDKYTGITSNGYAANVLRLAGMSAAGQPFPSISNQGGRMMSKQSTPAPDPNDIGTHMSNLDAIISAPIDFTLPASTDTPGGNTLQGFDGTSSKSSDSSGSNTSSTGGDQTQMVDVGGGYRMRADAAEGYRKASEAVGKPIPLVSAYRSFAEQQSLYNQLNGKSPVAKPGTSEHEKGLAVDVKNVTPEIRAAMLAAGWQQFDPKGDPNHFSYGVSA